LWVWRLKVQVLLFTFLWLIENDSNNNSNTLRIFIITALLLNNWKISVNFNSIIKDVKFLQFRKNLLNFKKVNNPNFKQLNKFSIPSFKKSANTKSSYTNHKTFTLYKIFLNTSILPTKNSFKVHPSTKSFFLNYSKLSVNIFNINKLFNRWQDFYYLILNIFFYNLPLVTFGTSVFKNELLSLNWFLNEKLKQHWRYVRPYIFTKENKINDEYTNIFSSLKLKGLTLSFVINVDYHKKTIYYLKRFNFFTIGVVPVTSNLLSVDFALPSSCESMSSHLFFIRTILYIKKLSEKNKFDIYQKSWGNK
jgi:hypothetical protein